MTEPDGPPYDTIAYRRTNRAARRWIATIRETILKKITYYDKMVPMAVLESDLRQCERLLEKEKILNDAVFHLWRQDGMRHGILWVTFERSVSEKRWSDRGR